MWWAAVLALHVLLAPGALTLLTPQNCSLRCVLQGRPGCEYCRVSWDDMRDLGFKSTAHFGSCVPRPCFRLFGDQDPQICQHYVHAPDNVSVELIHDPNPTSDTMVVSWRPSYYGIAFLRGFQVSLQALGGTGVSCQLLLFNRNLSLSASDALKVYKSDPFPDLPLGSQFAVTVMALPVPEKWSKFYQSKIFSTRSCSEKNSLDRCKKDWYPRFVSLVQREHDVTVTFNLAPSNLSISSYFCWCYANGNKKYTDLKPDLSRNRTHHSFQLKDLQERTNYTCEIAADEVDAVRKTFSFQTLSVSPDHTATRSVSSSVALAVPLALLVAAMFVVAAVAVARRRSGPWKSVVAAKPGMVQPETLAPEEKEEEEEVVLLTSGRSSPPRLLVCYSSVDGDAHVQAVMQLAAFIQQHMATRVCLDRWDTLGVAMEGSMSWYCRQIRDCDFILVVCSPGLGSRPADHHHPHHDDESLSSDLMVRLIGEEVGRAQAGGRDLSKYMTATFGYSDRSDVPTELRLASHYSLTSDLPLLFSHLHAVALHRPGGLLKISNISDEGFMKLPAGGALLRAISEAAAVRSA